MSIEKDLSSIAASLAQIAAHLTATPSVPTLTAASTASLVAIPPAPVVAAPVVPTAPLAPPAVTLAPPVTATPAPLVPAGIPFNDPKSMITYVMGKYKELGAAKGQQIQTVLAQIGVTNINEVKIDQYAMLYAGIEAIK